MIRQRDPTLTWLPHPIREPIVCLAKWAARKLFYWAWLFDPIDAIEELVETREQLRRTCDHP